MRILIVDDHLIFAQSLAVLLSSMPDLDIVGMVGNGKLALEYMAKNDVDVVLSDLQMPEMNGATLAFKLREKYPETKVLMVSMVEKAEQIAEVIQLGVRGFLLKNAGQTELHTALKTIERGDTYFSLKVMQILTQPSDIIIQRGAVAPELATLSEREIAVLKLITQEFTSQEMAEKLCVSVNTIESHRRRLSQKLGVKNGLGLVKFAIRNGLIEA